MDDLICEVAGCGHRLDRHSDTGCEVGGCSSVHSVRDMAGSISMLLEDVKHLVHRNEELLRRTDELRHRRIFTLPRGGTGTCSRCQTGQYGFVSATTWLEVREDDALVRIDHVPVVECDVCGDVVIDLENAAALDEMLAGAERAPAAKAQVVRRDFLDTCREPEADRA